MCTKWEHKTKIVRTSESETNIKRERERQRESECESEAKRESEFESEAKGESAWESEAKRERERERHCLRNSQNKKSQGGSRYCGGKQNGPRMCVRPGSSSGSGVKDPFCARRRKSLRRRMRHRSH